MLKEHHYKSHPVIWEIVLDPDDMNQTLDMTPGSIGNISKSLDYPTISKYRVGECTIKFNDPEGVFSVNNSNNYFVMNRLPQSGYKVGILIKTGFIVDGVRELATYFNGNIIRINQNIGDATTELICVDKIRDLYVDDLKNYGIHRKFGIKSDSNIDSQHGIYPIMPALLPASEDSIIATRDLNQELNLVDELSSEGDINTDNYIVSEDRLESERGIIVQRDADGNAILGDDGEPLRPSTGFPQIELKSPQRYIVLNALIKDILSESNITNYSIDIPNQEVDHHFSSNGRVFYDLISSRDNTRRVQGIGSSVSATWEGYPTDAIVYDGKYYFFI